MYSLRRDRDPLCCCEYINKDGERSHILMCCCDCVELDRAADSVLCCRRDQRTSCDRVARAILDRLRLPWAQGAKQLTCDVLLPTLLLPAFITFGALGLPFTVVAFVFMPILMIQIHKIYYRAGPNSKFFCSWTYTSFAFIFIIYEFLVVPFLEISAEENYIFMLFLLLSMISLYKVQTMRTPACRNDVESAGSTLSNSKVIDKCSACETLRVPRMAHCNHCQVCIPDRELHCLWFGCCIGSHNLLWFLLCLIFLSLNLLYSSNLILTTVCRPYQVWGSLLLPDDCSEVYYEYRFSVCFVTGLYALVMAVIPIFALLRQCWLISIGMTGNEWRTLPLSHILACGITANRPHSHGVLKNWLLLLTCRNRSD